jgi:hypothetical protein
LLQLGSIGRPVGHGGRLVGTLEQTVDDDCLGRAVA